MNVLLVSDLHLNDNPRDEYRWLLFPRLRKIIREKHVSHLFVLGDLTDEKDRHNARLVNRVVDALSLLIAEGGKASPLEVWLLMGNHDNIDPGCAFFRFLDKMPQLHFVSTPFMRPFDGHEVLMLPHTRTPLESWAQIDFMHKADFIFLHGTMTGAAAESGQLLEGIPPGALVQARKAKIFGGDIHVPQRVGRVEYVGAPYPVRFGDNFEGRAILLTDWRTADEIPLPSIRRVWLEADAHGIGAPGDTGKLPQLSEGDQVKVRVRLSQAEYHLWNDVKKYVVEWCANMKLQLCGLELQREEAKAVPKLARRVVLKKSGRGILDDFCQKNKVDKSTADVGHHILQSVERK